MLRLEALESIFGLENLKGEPARRGMSSTFQYDRHPHPSHSVGRQDRNVTKTLVWLRRGA